MYIDADSLLNKREELQMLILVHSPDIICIREFARENSRLPVQEVEVEIVGCDLFSNITKCEIGVLV